MIKKTIKLLDFWSTDDYRAVRCKSKKEAKIFINACVDIGEKSFSLANVPYYFGEKTPDCLSIIGTNKDKVDEICFTNEGCFSDYDFYKNRGFKMYEFEDIEFNRTAEEKIIANIIRLLKQYDCDVPERCAKEIYKNFIEEKGEKDATS